MQDRYRRIDEILLRDQSLCLKGLKGAMERDQASKMELHS